MPVVLRVRGFIFWFYEADLAEQPHVHVGKGGHEAKFWLNPVEISRAGRFREIELHSVKRIIDDNLEFLLSAWAQEKSKHVNG